MEVDRRSVALLVHHDRLHAAALADHLQGRLVDVHVVCPDADVQVLHAERVHNPSVILFVVEPGGRTAEVDVPTLLASLTSPVLAVVHPSDEWSALRLIDAGAVGYLTTDAQPEDLSKAVEAVVRGIPLMTAQDVTNLRLRKDMEDARRRDEMGDLLALSDREAQVLGAMVEGWTPDVIARSHGIAVSTVRSHVRSILRKLDVTSQLEAVAIAHRYGWRSPRD